MSMVLTDRLAAAGIAFEPIYKAEKVRLLARWSAEFGPLADAARRGAASPRVLSGGQAELFLAARAQEGDIIVLPNDGSGMSALRCPASALEGLSDLLADTQAGCEEIVVIDVEFGWSAVLVNHGAAGVGHRACLAMTDS